ncbi:NADPH:quinone reductase [Devosia pacifica]|uniref:NADPH:quinone reductase n=1 Tax=Devosia pacifica TaxID=1335967 RepID=A0A918RZB7_9HYPH|nr:NAD(P)-dependent alcohol dehydrogenase [Devosia pacifica]GHA16859.1 NADPH:quinone reductase [Devosia pacifica]
MKAVAYDKYGPPDNLRLEEQERPEPAHHELQVRVHAVSLNSWDWERLCGRPLLARIEAGWQRPVVRVLGADIAGTVSAVGAGVTGFSVGDRVFADLSDHGWGGLAEYATVRAELVAHIGEHLDFVAAAAIPQAGSLALQAIAKAAPQPGERLLMVGGGGGVGTFAIQLAKAAGAQVTGLDSAEKAEIMRRAGADHVLDYRQTNYLRAGTRYDVILDCVTRRPVAAWRHALAPRGRMVMIGGTTRAIFAGALAGPALSRLSGKSLGLLMYRPNAADLETLGNACQRGDLSPLIDSVHPLEQTAEALRRLGSGQVQGKIVLRVFDP